MPFPLNFLNLHTRQRCDALQREHAALSKEEQILRGKLSRSETDVARLSELKQEMGDRVQQLEKVKSDQTDVIGRYVGKCLFCRMLDVKELTI